MRSLTRVAVAAAAVALFVMIGEVLRPVAVIGDVIKDTRIVNTSAEPIPTTVQGTVAVSGAVSGTVLAQQSGPWTVGVNSLPLVGIDPAHNTVQMASAGGMKLLLDGDFTGLPTGGQFIPPVDLSHVSKIRVSGTINGSGDDITYEILSGPTADGPDTNLRFLDEFSTNDRFSKVYDVPGVSLHIKITPHNGNNQSLIQIYGS